MKFDAILNRGNSRHKIEIKLSADSNNNPVLYGGNRVVNSVQQFRQSYTLTHHTVIDFNYPEWNAIINKITNNPQFNKAL